MPQTVGPEPQGTGGVPPLLQIAGHVEQRGATKKLTSVLPATKALAKMTNCTRRDIKLNNVLYKNKSGTLVAVG